jgi:hypothetical protein
MLLILNFDTVDILNSDGWTRDRVKKYIAEHTMMPLAEYQKRFGKDGKVPAGVPDSPAKPTDPSGMVPMPSIDQLLILVAGGPPGEKNMMVPIWAASKPTSKEIRLPGNWKAILAKATP